MKCPECKSEHIRKNGIRRGKQNHICVSCDRQFVENPKNHLRHYLARLHRKTLCYSKSEEMLKHSIRLLIHYLKFEDVPIPYRFLP